MRRMVLWFGVGVAALVGGVFLSYAIRFLVGFRPDVMFAAAVLLLTSAFWLLVSERSMNDKHYGLTGNGIKEGGGTAMSKRDIGHLPGRAHRTFSFARHALGASVGNLRLLAGVGYGHVTA